MIPMFRDDGLKLTVAKYYTPNGRSIDGVGIIPDVEVALEKPVIVSRELDTDTLTDTQLLKAEEILTEKLSDN